MDRRVFLIGSTASLSVAGYGGAFGQSFPTKLIRIVVPTGPGAPPDVLSRIVAKALSAGQGWDVIVEDKPGGAQTVGAIDVLKHPADGYTLFTATPPVTAIAGLVSGAPFKVEKGFTPVVQIGTGYNMLVVNTNVPAHSVSEFVAYLKREPGKHTFSSGGFGTPAHLLGELFKRETGVQTTHVPYPHGAASAMGDLISGVNTYQFMSVLPALQMVKTGKIRALAIMGRKRLAILPDVPTIVEAGYPQLESEDWSGFLVKAGTSPSTIATLNGAVNKALETEQVRNALANLGVDVGGGTPEKFGALLHAETVRWTKVIEDAGIKMD